jgi:hypothetical protein
VRTWNSAAFPGALKADVEHLPSGTLPLAEGTTQGGYVDDSKITATVLSTTEDARDIVAHLGIFFIEIVVNCGCGDDPMEQNAYCEMDVRIDKATGAAEFSVRRH